MSSKSNTKNTSNNKRNHKNSNKKSSPNITQPSVKPIQHLNLDTDVTKVNNQYKHHCSSTNSITPYQSSLSNTSTINQRSSTTSIQQQNISMIYNLQKRNKKLAKSAQFMMQMNLESNKKIKTNSYYNLNNTQSTESSSVNYKQSNSVDISNISNNTHASTSCNNIDNNESLSFNNNVDFNYNDSQNTDTFDLDSSQEIDDNNVTISSFQQNSYCNTATTGDSSIIQTTSNPAYITSAQANLDFTEQYNMESLLKFEKHQRASGYLNNDKYYLTSEQKAGLELSQLLDTNGIPKYLFDDIMHWAASNNVKVPYKYNKMLTEFTKKMNYHSFFAKSECIELDIDGQLIEIVYFNFLLQVFSLLTDKELMHPDNLLFGNNPNKYNENINNNVDKTRGDVDCCQWFFDTLKVLTQHRHNHVVCGIIFFIDETYFDSKGVKRAEPVSFTLSIFKRHIRYKPKAWRHLGFIPKMINRRPKGFPMAELSRLKVMDYHKCLSKILNSFKETQKKGPYQWKFDHYNDICYLHFPLMFITGDMLGHNKLCGRYSNFVNTKSILQDCDMLSQNAHICGCECS